VLKRATYSKAKDVFTEFRIDSGLSSKAKPDKKLDIVPCVCSWTSKSLSLRKPG